MDYRTLGTSGTVVSEFALGTMTFGAEADETDSHAILDTFVEAGGTFVDTADVYSKGESESIMLMRFKQDGPELDRPADSIAVARIDTGSFTEKNIIAKTTLDERPSTANQQKRAFASRIAQNYRTLTALQGAAGSNSTTMGLLASL